jgi:hypothetical protein
MAPQYFFFRLYEYYKNSDVKKRFCLMCTHLLQFLYLLFVIDIDYPCCVIFGSTLPPVVCGMKLFVECLIYVICVCLHIVVSNAYCIVFFLLLCALCCQFLWIVLF